MILAIEIGGTKLQLAVGQAGGEFVDVVRQDVSIAAGAQGILEQIEAAGLALAQKHKPTRIGVGFGGPVDRQQGIVLKSHQVNGWNHFPLAQWCQKTLGLPAVIGNDCDVAALAEATFGAGRDAETVFYVTVGTGIGGGLVSGGRLFGVGRPAVAEIGHLRPGLLADRPEATVEALAAGPGIAAAAQDRLTGQVARPISSALHRAEDDDEPRDMRQRLADAELADEEFVADLLGRCEQDVETLTAKHVAQAAVDGNEIARDVLAHAQQALGWAIAQAITLLAVEVVVIGGGVSLTGERYFLAPLRQVVERYVFPPLKDSYQIVPTRLGEEVVLHGAMALAEEEMRNAN